MIKNKISTLFHKKNIKGTLLNTVFFLFLLSLLYHLMIQIFVFEYGFGSWQLSEFLINYQGGFVRRGLIGEILFQLSKNFNINIERAVKIICLISFTVVCLFFIRSFLKKGYALYILPLCFFLGMGILSDAWIRKDYLMLGFFIAILNVYQLKFSIAIKIIVVNILTIFVLLTHEVFAFFTLPVMLILFFNHYKNKGIIQSPKLAVVSLIPSIACFFLTLVYHGTSETAQDILNSWQLISNNEPAKMLIQNAPAVDSIGWASQWAFKHHFALNFLAADKGVFAALVWLFTFPIIYYMATNALFVFRKEENSFTTIHKAVLSSILIFQLFCLLPVFAILSCDYVRLCFYWIASSFAIFLIIPTEKIIQLIPLWFEIKVQHLNDFLANILRPQKTTLVFLMLFFSISPYSFFTDGVIANNMIYNVLFIVSKPLILLEEYLHSFLR